MSRGRDPYWITVRYPRAVCAGCRGPIPVGKKAFFYPDGKKMYCYGSECGIARAREFDGARADEAQMVAGRYW